MSSWDPGGLGLKCPMEFRQHSPLVAHTALFLSSFSRIRHFRMEGIEMVCFPVLQVGLMRPKGLYCLWDKALMPHWDQ